MSTKIEWCGGDRTPESWNFVVGCEVVSPGCTNCYAMKQAARCAMWGIEKYRGLVRATKTGPVWTGQVAFDEKALFTPLKWKKPRRVFVDSMGDLFYARVPLTFVWRGFAIMAACLEHEFILLTKRAAEMRAVLSDPDFAKEVRREAREAGIEELAQEGLRYLERDGFLPNVILGVSAEDQRRADERIPELLDTPAARRAVSLEPLLGPINLTRCGNHHTDSGPLHLWKGGDGVWRKQFMQPAPQLDWVIIGGESGPGARKHNVEWSYDILEQCGVAGVAAFEKQLGANPVFRDVPCPTKDSKGGDPEEWPEGLRVREWPAAYVPAPLVETREAAEAV